MELCALGFPKSIYYAQNVSDFSRGFPQRASYVTMFVALKPAKATLSVNLTQKKENQRY